MANGVFVRAEINKAGASKLKNSPANFARANTRAALRSTVLVERAVREDALGGRVRRSGLFYISEPGNRIAKRTGRSASRINSDVFQRGDSTFGVVGSPDKNVLVNEVGATIRGRPTLVIPTVHVQTPTGAMKEDWAGVRLRDVWKQRKLFVLRRKGAVEGLVARRYGSLTRNPRTGRMERRSEPLFLLRRSVSIAARHMFRTVARKLTPQIVAEYQAAMKVEVASIAD